MGGCIIVGQGRVFNRIVNFGVFFCFYPLFLMLFFKFIYSF